MSTTRYEVVRREIKAKERVLTRGDVFTWEDLCDDELRAKRQIKTFIEHGLVMEHKGEVEPEITEEPSDYPKHVGGPWYETPDGDRFKGKKAALAAMQG